MDLPPYLLKLVSEGKCVLVLGAGASVGAIHASGNVPPSGAKLGRTLANRFLGGNYTDLPLSLVAELSISESDLRTVQEFIRDLLDPFEPAAFHKLVPTFKWHGIATLNYDLVIERAYQGRTFQTLQPLVSNRDRFEDFRAAPTDLMFLKLHGCITRVADPSIPLILTPDQYVTHKKGRSRLFDTLRDWGRERTLLFVGTTLVDFDLREILLDLTEEEPSRPRYYLVTPTVSEHLSRLWERKGITMIPLTFQQFLEQLAGDLPGIARAVPVPPPSLPVFARFSDTAPALTESTRLLLEHDLEYVHAGMRSESVNPKRFYLGYDYGWGGIQHDLDCRRDLVDDVLLDVVLDEDKERPAELIVIRAEAGAGKSVLLRRLAWEAACDFDAFCLYAKPDAALTPEALAEIADYAADRIFLFVDDVADRAAEVERLIDRATKNKLHISILVAERSNEWNVACEGLLPFVNKEYQLPYLSDREIGELIELLEAHDAIGTLKAVPRQDQERAFRKHAGRQLLVALHEATLGKPFEEIVKDEFDAIVPETAQSIYLTTCTLNRAGTPVRAGLISRVHGVTFERFKADFLAPLEHVVITQIGRRGYDYEYRCRHPHIAELVFRQVLADPDQRFDRIARILRSLNISFATDRRSFEQLITARTLMELFPEHLMIAQIYALAEERARDDGHVFLQHGIYEMRRPSGNLTRSAELFRAAHDLLPNNVIVTHSYAELELRLAEAASSDLVREKHLQKVRALIRPLLRKGARTAHAYHTAFKVEHFRLRSLLEKESSSGEALTIAIRNAETALAEGLQRFPGDEYLLSGEASLAEILADSERVTRALEQAVEANVRNTHIVGSLAQTYRKTGQNEKARQLLERAIDAQPYDRRLNYLLGRLLLDISADGTVIESHLRKSFTEGDRNYEAQFWYARQLFLNGKEDDARARFEELKRQPMAPLSRRRVRGEWICGSEPLHFTGTIKRIEKAYAFVERDGPADTIYIPTDHESNVLLAELSPGQRVRFTIAFNVLGPVALNVSSEKS